MMLRWVMLLTGLGLFGCVTGKKSVEPALDAEDVPHAVASVQAWDQLSEDARQQIIEGDYSRYRNLTATPRQRPGEVPAGALRAFADKMIKFMQANGDMSSVDSGHAKVGGVQAFVQIVQLNGQQVLGGQVSFEQQGCDMPDESGRAFRGIADAEGAGCELGVGMWAAYGTFDRGGAPLEYGDFLEWEPAGAK